MSGFLAGVQWTPVATQASTDQAELPSVTHEGVLHIGEQQLRCYRLTDGRAIINADDLHALFGDVLKGERA